MAAETVPANSSAAARHRRCIVVRGTPEHTAAAALALVADLAPGAVLWVGAPPCPSGVTPVDGRAATALLGQDKHAVVLDLHVGLNADLLAAAQGFVRGGGALILRADPTDAPVPPGEVAGMTVWPHGPEAVGGRFRARIFQRLLAGAEPPPPHPLAPAPPIAGGTPDQAALVANLAQRLAGAEPTVTVLTADRGRGKSSALGLALARLQAVMAHAPPVLSALEPAALGEVIRFASVELDPGQPADLEAISTQHVSGVSLPRRRVEVAPVETLLGDTLRPRVIIVDEAAQVPVPWLRRLVRSQPQAHLVFASTVHGYEGTGRGFGLRFVPWLATEPRPCFIETLRTPIRWPVDDALEARIFDALLLDAEPAAVPALVEPLRFERLDRDALAADEARLREVFGLLVVAHYRTTPADLHRLLDAPNLAVWVALTPDTAEARGVVVGACLVAEEGGLPPELSAQAAAGRVRLRGHALPDTFVSHLGEVAAGALRWIRSVRVASHPGLRRHGIATRLTEHIQGVVAAAGFDAMGTLFGASPEVLRFRQALGYDVVRLSASRGSRTGEPSACMVRAFTPAAQALVDRLRTRFARDLPVQLALMQADLAPPLDPELVALLGVALPPVTPLTAAEAEAGARTYAFGPAPFEAEAVAVTQWIAAHLARLERLGPAERAVVTWRVIEGRGWGPTVDASGLPSYGAAMRALRRAVRTLLADA